MWKRARIGIVIGAAIGGLCVLAGIGTAAIAVLAGQHVTAEGPRDLGFVLLYLAGFTAAGAAVGALWPLRRSRPGAYVLGYIGAGIVCSVCGEIVMQLEHDHDPHAFVFVVGFMTLAFGTVAGYRIGREA